MQTAYVLDSQGRILRTAEPDWTRGPLFAFSRNAESCAWAVRDDVPAEIAAELDSLAALESPSADLRAPPRYAGRYVALLRSLVDNQQPLENKQRSSDGPAFSFPSVIPELGETVRIESEDLINHHLPGWLPGEIAAGRSPVMAVSIDGYPVSACCCARRSELAAEAGLDTAEPFRGRGFGPTVTAAWARAVREEGLTPLYSTQWTNHASLSVARKLGLVPFACTWKLDP